MINILILNIMQLNELNNENDKYFKRNINWIINIK